jgi:hypothetical protein
MCPKVVSVSAEKFIEIAHLSACSIKARPTPLTLVRGRDAHHFDVPSGIEDVNED